MIHDAGEHHGVNLRKREQTTLREKENKLPCASMRARESEKKNGVKRESEKMKHEKVKEQSSSSEKLRRGEDKE